MALSQDPLGRKETWEPQVPKVTGALLDHEVLQGPRAPEGTKERKGIKVTKSILGGGREVLPSSHKLHRAEPSSWTSSWVPMSKSHHPAETKSPSNTCFSLNEIYTYSKLKDTQRNSSIGWVDLRNSCSV